MASLLYATRFELPRSEGLEGVLARYEQWIDARYDVGGAHAPVAIKLSRDADLDLPKGHLLEFREHQFGGLRAAVLEWTFPAGPSDSLMWTNSIRVGELEDCIALEHSISVSSREFVISPPRLAVGSPQVIRQICAELDVRIGEMQLRATPYPITSEGVKDLVALLKSQLRKIPVVMLTPYANEDRNLIRSDQLARTLAGVAIVVTMHDTASTRALSEEIGGYLSCYDGGARVYWPGFDDRDDGRNHPLYFGSQIASSGPKAITQAIERSIFPVAAFRFSPDLRVSEIIDGSQSSARATEIFEKREDSGLDWETYALQISSQLDTAKEELRNVLAENKNLKENAALSFSTYSEEQPSNAAPSASVPVPTTVSEAVSMAKKNLGSLVILDDAVESARKSPFKRPSEIYDFLVDLNEVSETWSALRKETGSGGDLRQHLIARGWGKRVSWHISDTSKGKWGSDYQVEYKGETRTFEPHVTLGARDATTCASIHFIPDPDDDVIVVGHIGRHLTNTSS